MGKAVPQPQGPPAYRDDPDHAETASMASAMLLDEVEAFPDEELPSYSDMPIEPDTTGASSNIDFSRVSRVSANSYQSALPSSDISQPS